MNKSFDVCRMLLDYEAGLTVRQVGEKNGVSGGKAYALLKEAGCAFRSRGFGDGFIMPREAIEKSAAGRRGQKRSKETKAKLSEARKCHFNGMNGYGHAKLHTGYKKVYAPDHPGSTAEGYVMLHRILIEREIGRYLESDECVHHINRVRTDNRLENLQLMTHRSHMAMHMSERHARRRLLSTAQS